MRRNPNHCHCQKLKCLSKWFIIFWVLRTLSKILWNSSRNMLMYKYTGNFTFYFKQFMHFIKCIHNPRSVVYKNDLPIIKFNHVICISCDAYLGIMQLKFLIYLTVFFIDFSSVPHGTFLCPYFIWVSSPILQASTALSMSG